VASHVEDSDHTRLATGAMLGIVIYRAQPTTSIVPFIDTGCSVFS
jgi:hypothetical protein